MQGKVWLNDGLVDAAAACVSAFDAGLLHGIGLFETMRAANGKVFRLEAHLDRLINSARKLSIRLRADRDGLARAVTQTVSGNGLTDARVRLTATPGSLLDQTGETQGGGTLIVTASSYTPYPSEYYKRGMTVTVTPYRQPVADPAAGHKTTNYLGRLTALRQAQQIQAGEALWFTPDNRLAEGSISNIFLVRAGVLLTPPLDTPVLRGITRAIVLTMAGEAGIETRESALTIDDLLDADESFLTNSIMGVMPVCRVERKAIGDEKPGPITRRLSAAYDELLRKECHGDE